MLAATERLASWLTGGRVTRLMIDADDKRRNSVVDGYGFAQQEAEAQPTSARPAPQRSIAIWITGFVRRRIWPHYWQYVVAAIAGLVAVVALGRWYGEVRTNSQLQADLVVYRRAGDEARSAFQRSLDDLKTLNTSPSEKVKVETLYNQLSNAMKLIDSLSVITGERPADAGGKSGAGQLAPSSRSGEAASEPGSPPTSPRSQPQSATPHAPGK
jgi:type II secretory pathway pseudopilin PulG